MSDMAWFIWLTVIVGLGLLITAVGVIHTFLG